MSISLHAINGIKYVRSSKHCWYSSKDPTVRSDLTKTISAVTSLLNLRAANIFTKTHKTLTAFDCLWRKTTTAKTTTCWHESQNSKKSSRFIVKRKEEEMSEGWVQKGNLHKYFHYPSPPTASWSLGWTTYRSMTLPTQRCCCYFGKISQSKSISVMDMSYQHKLF